MLKNLLSLAALFAVFTLQISAQDFEGKILTISQYEVMVDGELASQARFLNDFKEDVNLALQGKDWLTDRLTMPVYGILKQELENAWGVKVAHKDTLQGVSFYSPYGYPVGSMKKAIASGRGELYAKVYVNLFAGETRSYNSGDPFGVTKSQHQAIRPKIQIILKVYDPSGEVVYRGKSKVKSDEFHRATRTYLLDMPVPVGGERPDEDEQSATLMSMVIDAIYLLLPLENS